MPPSAAGPEFQADPLEAAKDAFRAKNLEDAERLCRESPISAGSLSLLGRIQAVTGRDSEALASLSGALALAPNNPDILNLLAYVHWRRGELGEAAALYSQIATQGKANSQVWNCLGQVQLGLCRYDEAQVSLSKSLAGAAQPAPIHHQIGIAFHKLGRFREAAEAYKKAVGLDPASVDSWENLGHALYSAKDPSAAAYFQMGADAVGPGPGRDWLRAKALSYGNGDLAEAEKCVQSVIADHASGAAYALLGNIRQQQGMFEEAAESFRRATELSPDEAGPYTALVNIRKVRPGDEALLARISEMIESPHTPEPDKVTLYFALGKADNDIGKYEQALDSFARGHRIERELLGIPFDRAKYADEFDRIIDIYSREVFAAAAVSGNPSEIPVLIVGMPRSGTTLADRILSAHPQVGAAGELRFWNDLASSDFKLASDLGLAGRAGEEYLRILGGYGSGKARVTDKAPWNYQYVGRVLLALPHARIIHVRRQPIDNALSLFMTPFEVSPAYVMDPGDLVFAYRIYERLMVHWRRVVPAGSLLEITYEGMVEDTEKEARRMVDFCGLEWNEACLHPEENALEIRTASVWQARQPVNRGSLDRWKRYEPWLGELRQLLEP